MEPETPLGRLIRFAQENGLTPGPGGVPRRATDALVGLLAGAVETSGDVVAGLPSALTAIGSSAPQSPGAPPSAFAQRNPNEARDERQQDFTRSVQRSIDGDGRAARLGVAISSLAPETEDDAITQLARMMGSSVPFIVANTAGNVVAPGIGTLLASGAGASAGAASGVADARANGASGEDAKQAVLGGVIGGSLESIPIDRAITRGLSTMLRSGNPGAAIARTIIGGAAEEAAQESAQQALLNKGAQRGFDEERGILEGVAESAAAGGAVGAILSGFAAGLGARQRGGLTREGAVAQESQREILDAILEGDESLRAKLDDFEAAQGVSEPSTNEGDRPADLPQPAQSEPSRVDRIAELGPEISGTIDSFLDDDTAPTEDGFDRINELHEERRKLIAEEVLENGSAAFRSGGGFSVVTKDPSGSGRFRVSFIGADGIPNGHTEHNSLEEAVSEISPTESPAASSDVDSAVLQAPDPGSNTDQGQSSGPESAVVSEPDPDSVDSQPEEAPPEPTDFDRALAEAEEQAAGPASTPEGDREVSAPEGEPAGKINFEVVDAPIESIKTDEGKFQPRTGAFSERTAERIATDFDPNLFEPIVVRRDPDTGEDVVLAGHSRLEGMRRRGAASIPVRFFQGTEAEAKRFAAIENDKGTALENFERADFVRQLRADGSTKKDIRAEAEKLYGKNARTVIAFSHLDPQGKAMQAVQLLRNNSSGDFSTAETMAKWVGEVMASDPRLTTRHENEIWDLAKRNFPKKNRPAFATSQGRFLEFVKGHIERTSEFGTVPESLNFERQVSKDRQQIEIDNQLAAGKKEVSDAQARLEQERTRLVERGVTGEDLRRTLQPFDQAVSLAQRDLLKLEQEAGRARRQARSQLSMFEDIDARPIVNPEIESDTEALTQAGVDNDTIEKADRVDPGDAKGIDAFAQTIEREIEDEGSGQDPADQRADTEADRGAGSAGVAPPPQPPDITGAAPAGGPAPLSPQLMRAARDIARGDVLGAEGREDLANPGASEIVQKMVDRVIDAAGEFDTEPRAAVKALAQQMIEADPAGVRAYLENQAKTEGPGAINTFLSAEAVNRFGLEALASDDIDAAVSVTRIAFNNQQRRREVARELGAAASFNNLPPAEQNRKMVIDAIFNPDPRVVKKMEKSKSKSGKEKIIRNATDRLKRLKKALAKKGLDVTNWTDEDFQNPIKVASAMRIASSHNSTTGDILYEYWINGLLSGAKTHVANLTGNTASTLWDFTAQRLTEAVVNELLPGKKADAARLGEFKHIWAGASLSSMTKAWNRAQLAFRTQAPIFSEDMSQRFKSESFAKSASAFDPAAGQNIAGAVFKSRAATKGAKGDIIRSPSTFLLAADEFAKSMIVDMQVGAEAYRIGTGQGLEGAALTDFIANETANLSSESSRRAYAKAIELTFQESENTAVKLVTGFRSSAKPIAFVIPFARTPVNLLRTAVRKSPLGIGNLLWDSFRHAQYKVFAGKDNPDLVYTRRRFTRDLAEQVLAWGVTTTLLGLVMNQDDEDPIITGANRRRNGPIPSSSIKVGDKYLSFERIEPLGPMVSLSVDLANAYKDAGTSGDPLSVAQEMVNSVRDLVTNKGSLQGFGDMMMLLQYGGTSGLRKFTSNFAASWSPAIVRHAASASDDRLRNYQVRGDGWDAILETMKATGQRMLPIAALAPAARVDVWGREMLKDSFERDMTVDPFTEEQPDVPPVPSTDIAYRMIVPFFTRDEDTVTTLDRSILNYNLRNPGEKWYPSLPEPAATYDGKKYWMSRDMYNTFLKRAGEITVSRLEAGVKSGVFEPDSMNERKIEAIRKTVNAARRRARLEMRQEIITASEHNQ